MDRKMHRELGVPADARVRFGLGRAHELAELAGCRLAEEWSHLDDPECRPAALRLFRGVEWVRRVFARAYERVGGG